MIGQPNNIFYLDKIPSGHEQILSGESQGIGRTDIRPDIQPQTVYAIRIFSVFTAALLLFIFVWSLYSS